MEDPVDVEGRVACRLLNFLSNASDMQGNKLASSVCPGPEAPIMPWREIQLSRSILGPQRPPTDTQRLCGCVVLELAMEISHPSTSLSGAISNTKCLTNIAVLCYDGDI